MRFSFKICYLCVTDRLTYSPFKSLSLIYWWMAEKKIFLCLSLSLSHSDLYLSRPNRQFVLFGPNFTSNAKPLKIIPHKNAQLSHGTDTEKFAHNRNVYIMRYLVHAHEMTFEFKQWNNREIDRQCHRCCRVSLYVYLFFALHRTLSI